MSGLPSLSSAAAVPDDQTALMHEILDGVYCLEALFEPDGRLLWASPSIESFTDWTPAECIEADDALALLVSESDLRYCRDMIRKVVAEGSGEDFEMRLVRKCGQVCWVSSHWRRIGGDGKPVRLRLSAENVQARKETEYQLLETVSELRRSRALSEHYLSRSNDERMRLTALLNAIRLGILFMDQDHRVLYYNRAMLDIWGFALDENLIGVRDVVLQSRVSHLLIDPDAYCERINEITRSGRSGDAGEIPFKDGRIVTEVSAIIEASDTPRGIGRVWIYEDVTEARQTAAKLVQLAERDPLTDLFNRRRFHEELDRVLADAVRRDYQVGLLVFDLDGFKPINDDFGHQAGDEVLVCMSRHVGSMIRRNETFFRLGGDEFAVLVPDADHDSLDELARRIVEGVASLKFEFEGREVGLTASAGIALFPTHALDAERLVAIADQAMYRSKSGGRNRWTFSDAKSVESDRMSEFGKTKRKED